MVLDIQSKEVIDKISDELKVQPALEIPRKLADNIQLSYDVSPPKHIQTTQGSSSDTTSVNIVTVSTTKRTFVVGISLSIAKDIVNDGIFTNIAMVPKGQSVAQTVFRIRYEPITVGQFTESILFPLPIELEKGSSITIVNGSGTASIDSTGIIYFYETDPQ